MKDHKISIKVRLTICDCAGLACSRAPDIAILICLRRPITPSSSTPKRSQRATSSPSPARTTPMQKRQQGGSASPSQNEATVRDTPP